MVSSRRQRRRSKKVEKIKFGGFISRIANKSHYDNAGNETKAAIELTLRAHVAGIA